MKTIDDFNWSEYTDKYYKNQLEEMTVDGYDFVIKKSTVENNKIIWRDNIHEFNKIMYQFIVEKKPSTVFECGCAGGHHLYNIKKLIPDIEVAGCELLESQVKIASKKLKIPKEITNKIIISNFIDFFTNQRYDFVYSNAVVMHLNSTDAVNFISCMAGISKKYIWLSEDAGQHDFEGIFKIELPEWKYEKIECGYFLTK